MLPKAQGTFVIRADVASSSVKKQGRGRKYQGFQTLIDSAPSIEKRRAGSLMQTRLSKHFSGTYGANALRYGCVDKPCRHVPWSFLDPTCHTSVRLGDTSFPSRQNCTLPGTFLSPAECQ